MLYEVSTLVGFEKPPEEAVVCVLCGGDCVNEDWFVYAGKPVHCDCVKKAYEEMVEGWMDNA